MAEIPLEQKITLIPLHDQTAKPSSVLDKIPFENCVYHEDANRLLLSYLINLPKILKNREIFKFTKKLELTNWDFKIILETEN